MKFLLILLMVLTAQVATAWNIPPADKEEAYLYYKNKIVNPGFENGTTNWTASAGTFSATTSTSDIGEGARAGSWNASAASQTLSANTYTIERALRGANGYAKCEFRTTATDYKIQVHDGTNVIVEQTIVPSTNYLEQGVNFVFPSSGTARLRVISASDAADIFLDDCYLGQAPNISSVNMNTYYGGVRFAGVTNCNWSATNTGGFVNFATDDDCTGRVLYGNATGPADTAGNRKPEVTFSTLPSGRYKVIMTSATLLSNSSGALAYNGVRISDGTNNSPASAMNLPTGDTTRLYAQNVVWNVNYTTAQSNITFRAQANASASGGVDIQTTNSNQDFEIHVFKIGNTEAAFRADTVATSWAGYHDSTCQWSTTSTSFVTPAADGSCGFTERSNTNFGTVASTGSRTPGITFTPLRPGKYRVCATTQLLNDTTFAYARLRLHDGTNTLGEASVRSSNGAIGVPATICGLVTAANTSLVTLNLQGNASSNTMYYGAYDNGVAAIDWTITAIDQQIPAPVLVGSVSTNSTGAERIERAYVAATCNASPCTIASQSGSWLSSITRASTGSYSLNFASGMFSAVPSCTILPANPSEIRMSGTPTTSAFTFQTFDSAGSFADGGFSVLCMGPR